MTVSFVSLVLAEDWFEEESGKKKHLSNELTCGHARALNVTDRGAQAHTNRTNCPSHVTGSSSPQTIVKGNETQDMKEAHRTVWMEIHTKTENGNLMETPSSRCVLLEEHMGCETGLGMPAAGGVCVQPTGELVV